MARRQARPCHVGDHCITSKMGLVLSMRVSLELVFDGMAGDGGAEARARMVMGEKRTEWMRWVSTAVSDAVAAQLAAIPDGDIEGEMAVINPDALGVTADGRVMVACAGVVTIHLAPKVDNNAANRASSTLNIPTMAEALTTTLADIRRWQTPHVGFSIVIVSTERVSMYVASNGEAYLPPVNDR